MRYFEVILNFCVFVFLLQAQNLNLNNVTPVKIFELMFQSPENSVSQDDAHLSGQ